MLVMREEAEFSTPTPLWNVDLDAILMQSHQLLTPV
jgi:hypothetical protein